MNLISVDSYFTGNAEWSLFNVSVRHMRFQEEGEERVEVCALNFV